MKEDWVEIELGELCKFSQGVQVPKGKQYTEKNENRVRFLRIIDFTQGKDEPRYIDKPNDINIVAKDDISMVRYGTVGFVCTGIEGAIANNLFRIIPKTDIDKKYLINFLNSVMFKSQINAKGATMQALNFGLIKPIKVSLSPLVEQKAIVKKIEELFSSLDSGIADLKKAQEQLKIYRQAVLKKAFEGDWKKVKLGKLITFGPTNGMYKPKSFYGRGTPILRIDGFYDGNINSWHSLKKLELDDNELETYSLQNDDIVVNRVNSMPYVGKSAIVKNLNGNCVFESNIMRLRVDDKIISPNFLVQFLISPNGYSELQKNVKHAVNQSSINQADVKNAIIPIPPLEQQHQIVQEIESRLSVCDKVEKDIADSLKKAQALRQSILKKAFEGKLLTNEEITTCKQHKDYEPASVLLEKIKVEKK